MKLFIYQGASLSPGSQPGDILTIEGVVWTVTEQGHLEAEVVDGDPDKSAADAITDVGFVSEQVEE